MKVYNYAEARQKFSSVLNVALEEDVVIARKDGIKFKLVPIQTNIRKQKSLLASIKGVDANVTMDDILESIRDRKI
jgi:antitoxin (DNA-binding transcriptional repressor) of toxin-antitoxin stability system